MSLEVALRLTEILLGVAIIVQCIEHLSQRHANPLPFAIRLVCALVLVSGVAVIAPLLGLIATGCWMLLRFNGPYNGGSDKMITLILWCLTAAHLSHGDWVALFMGYLAVQLTLSYFISGQVKIMNPAWRDGTALSDVFAYSAYPVGQNLRAFAAQAQLMRAGAWGVIGFEVLFPFTLLHPIALCIGLMIAAAFHLANACLFGLNHFFWAWIAAYPALIWLQSRIFGMA